MTIKKFICAFGILGSLKVWGADDLSIIPEEKEGSITSEQEMIAESAPFTLACENALGEEIKKQGSRYTKLYRKVAQLIAQIEEADEYLKPKSPKSSGPKQRQLSVKERNRWIEWRAQDLQNLMSLENSMEQALGIMNHSLDDCWYGYKSFPQTPSKDNYITYDKGFHLSFELSGFLNSYRTTLKRLQK